VPQTGSIADRDWFAEALLGCRTRPLESLGLTVDLGLADKILRGTSKCTRRNRPLRLSRRGTMNDRLKEIEGAIMARLPEDADDFARIKARQVAPLQVASERMTDRLAAGRRVMR
jgi:hypothetical protein